MARYGPIHATVLLLTLTVWGVALSQMSVDAVWFDEAWTAYYIGAAPDAGEATLPATLVRLHDNTSHENNPPGFYALLVLWGQLVGWGDVQLRLFALMVGVLAVPLVYRIGADFDRPRTGLLAALALSASGFFVYYLHEMRTYSLDITLAALGIWAYLHATERERGPLWGWLLLIGLSAVGMVYTHYSNTLILAPIAIYHLVFARKNRRWWGVTGAVIVAVLTFAPYLPTFIATYQRFASVTRDYIPEWTAWQILHMLADALTNQWVWLLIPSAAGMAWAAWRPQSAQQRRLARFVWVTVVLGVLLLVGLQVYAQIVAHIRYMATLWIPFALWVGLGLSRLERSTWIVPFVGLWLIGGAMNATHPQAQWRYTDELGRSLFRTDLRWDNAGDLLSAESTRFDAVAVGLSAYTPWSIQRAVRFYLQTLEARYLFVDFVDEPNGEIHGFMAGASNVWLVEALDHEMSDAYTTSKRVAGELFVACDAGRDVGGVRVTRYAISEACCITDGPPLATFDGITHLTHSATTQHPDRIDVVQQWRTVSAPTDDPALYSVAVHLLDAAGASVAQADYPLPAGADGACVPVSVSLAGVTSGDYEVVVMVYNWADGSRVLADGAGYHALGSVRVP